MTDAMTTFFFVSLLLTPALLGVLAPLRSKDDAPLRVSVTGGKTNLRVKPRTGPRRFESRPR